MEMYERQLAQIELYAKLAAEDFFAFAEELRTRAHGKV